jgi:hypothetical protein
MPERLECCAPQQMISQVRNMHQGMQFLQSQWTQENGERECRNVDRNLKGVAGVLGFEPRAFGFGDRRSNQLSYTPTRTRPLPSVFGKGKRLACNSFGNHDRDDHALDDPLFAR